jgi:integrase
LREMSEGHPHTTHNPTMMKPETLTFERTRDGFYSTRIRAGRHPRTGKGQQLRVTFATTDETVFRERLARLRELSAALIPQGLTAEAAVAIKKAAAQDTDAKFALMCESALSFAPEARAKRKTWSTFRDVAEAWTRGELHRRFPDHVKSKRTSKRDKGRLEYLCELVVDDESKRKLGDMPLTLITFEHANAAMTQLPADCKRPAARRQYAQLIARVMKLAVFPTACIAASPLPPNFLPHVPEGDLIFPHFYPDEDLRLMRCELIDYAVRALFGLCNREGGRLGEFLRGLKWSGIDVRRGTISLPGGALRKGGKPGKWQAEPGSLEALEPLRALGGEGPFSHLPDDGGWAERLQEIMRTAGLDREALYYSNVAEGFRKMRGHDTRATYITLALACGLSESHIMARSGHKTSKMVHRYDHAAEALAASDAGCKLMPLDFALGLYALGPHASRNPLPMPGPRRAGWMTLDASSPEAARLEALARPLLPAAIRVPLLGPGGGDGGGGASRSGPELTRAEAIDGELVDGEGDGPERSTYDAESAGGHTTGSGGGETEGETVGGFSGESAEAPDTKSSMICAAVAPAGVEPALREERDFKCLERGPPGARDELSPRNPVAGHDAKAHGVSSEGVGVRRSETPDDRVLASLRAAAHAAIDADDAALLAELVRLIGQRRAGGRTDVEAPAPAAERGVA